MGPRRDLRHDATEAFVQVDLRGDQVGAHVKPSSTIATAVSSQEVSMPRVIDEGRTVSGNDGHVRGQPPTVVGRPDVVGPHDQGVLVELR